MYHDAVHKNERNAIRPSSMLQNVDQRVIGFQDATFVWSRDAQPGEASSERNFVLRVEGELRFKRGSVNLIIGPTGSGFHLPNLLDQLVILTTFASGLCQEKRRC